jgi:GGDEF domain-containing protein
MNTEEADLPKVSTLEARKGEAVLLVVQNNEEKSLVISGVNPSLEALLGYEKDGLSQRRLETILGQREAASIADDLEYDDSAPDFGDIFSRIRLVRLRHRLGHEIAVNCTLSRLMSQGKNACFQIVIPSEHERLATTKLSSFIALNLEGRKELDPATGLPNHKTVEVFLPLLQHYLADSQMSVVFAVLRLDRYEKSVARYGKEACAELLKHAANCCRSAFRADDMIFALSDSTLGLLLFDISRESSRVVLNRLRWKIRGHRILFGGKADFSISTCIGFDMLDNHSASEVLERCTKAISDLDSNERNALVELHAV